MSMGYQGGRLEEIDRNAKLLAASTALTLAYLKISLFLMSHIFGAWLECSIVFIFAFLKETTTDPRTIGTKLKNCFRSLKLAKESLHRDPEAAQCLAPSSSLRKRRLDMYSTDGAGEESIRKTSW